MAKALLKTQRRQAKGQSIRWRRGLRHLAVREVSAALQEQRQYRARPQAHEIGSLLESFLFWLSFIFFRVIRIISVAAIKAFYEEADISRSPRLSSTLPRGVTAGQNRRTYRDPAVVENGDSVLSQEDRPPGVKKQPEGTEAYTSFAEYKPTPGQPSKTPSPQAAVQADLPQRLPRTDDPQQTKDKSRKDHLQAPKEALDAPRNQQSTAQDRIYVMVQPMPAPGTIETPYFVGQNVSQFIKQYEQLCARYRVTGIEKHQGLPEYCDYWIGMWIRSLPEFTAGNWTELVRKLRAEYRAEDYHRRIETRDFIEAFVRISAEQPGDLRHYVHDFTTISARTVAAGNLTEQEKGWWFM